MVSAVSTGGRCRALQLTDTRSGSRPPAPDQLIYTADFARSTRWWGAGREGKRPRDATACERSRVAGLALQDRAARARVRAEPTEPRLDGCARRRP